MNARPSDVTAAASRQRLHDLRAPLITTQGFGDELADAVARLEALVEAHRQELPADFLASTRDVFESDVKPCLGFLQSSIKKLGDVLDELSPRRAEDSQT